MAPSIFKDNTIKLPKTINTNFSSHSILSELHYQLANLNTDVINFDFSDVTFIASNQFAILGCIIDTYRSHHPNTVIYFKNLSEEIKSTIQKNGFYKHFNFNALPDKYHTTIQYTIFDINNINEFEKYVLLSIFNRQDIPKMSEKVRNKIIDNILEIFNNVKEHTNSKNVYACGQYFPKNSFLYFTIVDSGETIPYNVHTYCNSIEIAVPDNLLKWAIAPGHTTRQSKTPGGLGLSLLQDFIEINNGKLYIVSGNEVYEKNGKKDTYKIMQYPFPGTIVTMAFNLSDKSIYHMSSEDLSEIIF